MAEKLKSIDEINAAFACASESPKPKPKLSTSFDNFVEEVMEYNFGKLESIIENKDTYLIKNYVCAVKRLEYTYNKKYTGKYEKMVDIDLKSYYSQGFFEKLRFDKKNLSFKIIDIKYNKKGFSYYYLSLITLTVIALGVLGPLGFLLLMLLKF